MRAPRARRRKRWRQEVEAAGARALVHLADITDEAAVAAHGREGGRGFGRIDILVNNAAIRKEAPTLEMSLQEWHDVLGVVLDGAFLCSRAVLPHMVRNKYRPHHQYRRRQHASRRARPPACRRRQVRPRSASPRRWRPEFAPHGVTVNCVVPGRIGGERSATSGHGIVAHPPVGREGVYEDVADMVRLLCLPNTGYITGQTIHINGGLFMP